MRFVAVLSLILSVIPVVAQAEIYKWVDEHGQVHYGDKPKSLQQADNQKMDINENYNTLEVLPDDRKQKRDKLLEALDEKRQQKNEAAKKQQEADAKRAKQCLLAKDNLLSYQRSNFVYNLDKEGNRIVLPDSARENAISSLQKQIAINCK
jgi:hypothetical protein